MSRSSYIRKFKEICKIPPSTYITQRRIESAKNMLANTSYSISEIAYRTGFYDTSHFTKTFELETNLTPANYRKQHLI
jgi:AraC family transcriptional regulator